MLAGPDLWKIMLLKCSITMVFICPLLPFPFRKNNNLVIFPFTFPIFMPLANFWFIRTEGVSHPKNKKLPWHLPAHPTSEKAVGTWYRKNLYNGIHSLPPTLAVYDLVHFTPRRDVDRDFLFTEDEIRGHFS